MTKSHVVDLTITNNTDYSLEYSNDWFDSGRLADGYSWPTVITKRSTVSIKCYERDWALAGCSGWVQYFLGGMPLFFCFSNPSAGSNGIDIGNVASTWDDMTGHYDNGIAKAMQLSGSANMWVVANFRSTGGDDNQASWTLNIIDTSIIVPSDLQLNDVAGIFNKISTNATRQYYRCAVAPTMITGIAQSHFKGISAYADKLIFSHTNIDIVSTTDGAYLIGDKIIYSNQGSIEGTFDTLHPGWYHPCASQACGSFMAQGIQQSADGAGISEIQIYDIRRTAANQPAHLVCAIERPTGINGVAITKEIGGDGKYIVASVNGGTLTLYKSTSSSLIEPGAPPFTQIFETTAFAESGAGLALVTQTDGTIFLFTFNDDDAGGNSQMCLYQVDVGATPGVTKLGQKAMPIPDTSQSVILLQEYLALIVAFNPVIGAALSALLAEYGVKFLNSSFRWGKGLKVTSPSTIEVYASDRNVLPLSHIPLVGSDKDFSIVVWRASTPSNSMEVHVTSVASNYQTFTVHAQTAFTAETEGTWQLLDNMDLAFIKTANTPNNKV